MTALAILETQHAAGLSVSLIADRGVKVAPASRLTNDLRDLIRAHKTELTDWLEAANDDDLTSWRVTLAPGIPPEMVAKFRAASLELDRQIADANPGPDRWAWPNDPRIDAAMNGAEIERFTARLVIFMRRGLSAADADRLADRLVIRDREGDDRRTCPECQHYRRGRCGNYHAAGLGAPGLPADLVQQLQRCDGFSEGDAS